MPSPQVLLAAERLLAVLYAWMPLHGRMGFEQENWVSRDCCRMAKSSFLPRRNKSYFGQKVTKTLFGNSPILKTQKSCTKTNKNYSPPSRNAKLITCSSYDGRLLPLIRVTPALFYVKTGAAHK